MDNLSIHLEPARAFLFQLGAYLPRLLFALLILAAGWLVAKAVRFAVTRGLRAINFHVLTERAGLDGFLRQAGSRRDATAIFGLLAYGLVLLAALLVAFNSLGLSYVTALLSRVLWFIPNLFVALLILVLGAYFGRVVGELVSAYLRRAGMADTVLPGKAAQYAIVVFSVLIALDQLGIGGDIVRQSFLILLAGVVFALALAFGLGGRDRAAEYIEQWWPRRRREPPGGADRLPPRDPRP
ncbi:mechanosensitive ion channel family protein [Paracidovorax avenae]|uniref:mechanosensitive ion channel family protein n=1 Tax=Paracidovorax avenae TaxID=80867 RepID=UPI000D17D3F8|nr:MULTISPECIES: hypothetical protein [Comamonadaceae]AVS81907.1 hypothetical protein C8237_12950 [Paracidovorax avenae]AVS85582.1 hypothetical protein C8239_13155 [Paracidovorax avenae]AVS96453.1 hypothetical protein C8232_09440 [Paracidovorax avenae]AVT03283.1 hypothetical protein C8243_12870 [Paracidovorax avenae]AVT10232.1 hypothetical protein C8242_12630 [Paracidovorax avenae]